MRFKYSTIDQTQSESESLPRVPLVLRSGGHQLRVIGIVDSGATVNVLPYEMGVRLGGLWDDGKAGLRLTGNLGGFPAMPLVVIGQLANFPPVKLVFAWANNNNVPLLLGEMNFFLEFDVCFYRSKLEFEVVPKAV